METASPPGSCGPNGLTTTWDYDGFGRQVREERADGTETRTAYRLCEVGINCPVNLDNAVHFVQSQSSGGTPTIIYFDLLNREVRQETTNFDGETILETCASSVSPQQNEMLKNRYLSHFHFLFQGGSGIRTAS